MFLVYRGEFLENKLSFKNELSALIAFAYE